MKEQPLKCRCIFDDELLSFKTNSNAFKVRQLYLETTDIDFCRGKRTPMGAGPLFRSGREQRAHEEQIEAKHARDFTQTRSSPERSDSYCCFVFVFILA